jgi:hypothetical protein
MHIKNAVIDSATITNDDHGLLTAWLHLNYGNSGCQGFGGSALYLPKGFKHHDITHQYAGHWIWRIMEIAEVSEWSKLKGKSIRVELDKDGLGGIIQAIGHIVKDDWFNPSVDFKNI